MLIFPLSLLPVLRRSGLEKKLGSGITTLTERVDLLVPREADMDVDADGVYYPRGLLQQ